MMLNNLSDIGRVLPVQVFTGTVKKGGMSRDFVRSAGVRSIRATISKNTLTQYGRLRGQGGWRGSRWARKESGGGLELKSTIAKFFSATTAAGDY
jgi:hypothetical protein